VLHRKMVIENKFLPLEKQFRHERDDPSWSYMQEVSNRKLISGNLSLKSVMSDQSARRTERRTRSVHVVHEDFEHRQTQQFDCVITF
jgi:hypothetical protein